MQMRQSQPELKGHLSLVVLDSMTTIPSSEILRSMITHAYSVILHKHQPLGFDLVDTINEELGQACDILNFDSYGPTKSLQRMVYNVQKHIDFSLLPAGQAALEWIENFAGNSPVLLDILSIIIQELFEKASEASCNSPQVVQTEMQNALLMLKNYLSDPAMLTAYRTTVSRFACRCTKIVNFTGIFREAHYLLCCLTVFGYTPIPISVVTKLSMMIAEASEGSVSYGSLLQVLLKYNLVKIYPSPVVYYSSIRPSHSRPFEPEFVCVPLVVADSLWETMGEVEQVAVLGSCYHSLSNLTPEGSGIRFVLGLISLLKEKVRQNPIGGLCYSDVCELYDRLAHSAN